ncbi:TPA: sulfatase [Candidatus Poribacteria bacterium]|nr:sulfatase [Candidatus Poribacteria bacterium]
MRNQQSNILFICSDQHQTMASGCYGHSEVHTPNIDRIAAAGVRFNRTYCQSPVCVPARGFIGVSSRAWCEDFAGCSAG